MSTFCTDIQVCLLMNISTLHSPKGFNRHKKRQEYTMYPRLPSSKKKLVAKLSRLFHAYGRCFIAV